MRALVRRKNTLAHKGMIRDEFISGLMKINALQKISYLEGVFV